MATGVLDDVLEGRWMAVTPDSSWEIGVLAAAVEGAGTAAVFIGVRMASELEFMVMTAALNWIETGSAHGVLVHLQRQRAVSSTVSRSWQHKKKASRTCRG